MNMYFTNIDYFIHVLKYLNLETIGNVFLINKKFNSLDNNSLWKLLLEKESYDHTKKTYKKSYIYNYEIDYFNKMVIREPVWHRHSAIRVINREWMTGKVIFDINLEYNKIKKIPEGWLDGSDVGTVWLGMNNIKKIPENWLSQTYIRNIMLEYNQIESIPENWLKNTTSHISPWTMITLSDNKIKIIPSKWLNILRVSNLYLDNNLIEIIPEDWNPNILHLEINNNPMCNTIDGVDSIKLFEKRNPHIDVKW